MIKGLLAEPTGDVEMLRLMPRNIPSEANVTMNGAILHFIDEEAVYQPYQQAQA